MKRYEGEVVELDRDCELGYQGERAVVLRTDGKYMTLVFPNRANCRTLATGADYLFFQTAKGAR